MSVTKVKVAAPADLREGYTFDATVDGKTVGILSGARCFLAQLY